MTAVSDHSIWEFMTAVSMLSSKTNYSCTENSSSNDSSTVSETLAADAATVDDCYLHV